MQKRWLSELPLAKIVVPFIAGILLFTNWTIPLQLAGGFSILIFCGFLFAHFRRRSAASFFIAVLLFVLIANCAGILAALRSLDNQPRHYSHFKAAYLTGYIANPIEEKEKSYKAIIQIDSLTDSSNNWQDVQGKLLVYLEKDSSFKNLQIGDKILFPGNYKPVDAPKNPGQFDYRKFLSNKYIYYQGYLRNGRVIVTNHKQKFVVKRISDRIAIYVQSILRKYIAGKDNFALADGILLGHRSEIDEDLYNAFAYTGILHILSVSGLHVGIVYAMLSFLLGFIPDKNKKVKVAKFIFIVLFIWLFAFVTGLGAAVVRAAILFSLLNYGRINNEHTNQVNLLCGAALIQLLLDPMQLYDIGFQLSYLAMLGIFLLNKRIYSLFYSRYKLADWTWQLWSASIAAQVFTLPLSMYYFGNFPAYFLIANIFAIPLSTLILCISMALIPLSFIPVLASLAGKLTAWISAIFIKLTLIISQLPYGKISNLYISPWQVLFLFVCVSLFSWYLLRTYFKALLCSLAFAIMIIGISIYHTQKQWMQNEIVLYSISKQWAIAYNYRDKQQLISADTIPPKSFNYSIKNSHRKFHISSCQSFFLKDSTITAITYRRNLLFIGGKSFYFLNKQNSRLRFEKPLKIDYLLLTDNLYLNTDNIRKNFKFEELMLSPDNDARHLNIYRKLLDTAKINYVDLSKIAKVINL